MTEALTIPALLRTGPEDHPALSMPGGRPLSHGGLRTLVSRTAGVLAGAGIRPGDRVAIVLDNGPAMAAAFLGVASCATAAPLNPGYRATEFEFYLADLRAKLLVTDATPGSVAPTAAERLGIPVARLVPEPEAGAGSFRLEGLRMAPRVAPDDPDPSDIALVLHTSGTTSRPKLVPLSHRNLAASAHHVRNTLGLGAEDRGLAIMPLFHIHGLVAALLAPLFAGGEVCCPPRFSALRFLLWLHEVDPTWFTGVPTMHQAILLRAARQSDALRNRRLRFIRSSSAALLSTVHAELERVFEVPVLEAYGMTEAAHQIASNPLPPAARRPGTVGVAAGPEIRVVDAAGNPTPAGGAGEIVIRGANVMTGYDGNGSANAQAFLGDWFRTGDSGFLDPDGYLTITGRIKEIINRAGEKISPREVDEILLGHPAVHQCVTFALPHRMLGEEVAAAIVLRQGSSASEAELRRFAAERLADFKVPRKIVLLSEIPVGPTGKLQRIGLARTLGLA